MKIHKVGKAQATAALPPADKTKDLQKEAMIQYCCDQLQKTIQATKASAIEETRKERAEIERGS